MTAAQFLFSETHLVVLVQLKMVYQYLVEQR